MDYKTTQCALNRRDMDTRGFSTLGVSKVYLQKEIVPAISRVSREPPKNKLKLDNGNHIVPGIGD